MCQARHSMWCPVIQCLGCLLREKRLFTCRHACRSLTTLTHPASTLATLIKTTLCQAESEWYGVTVFPLPAWRKECQKHVSAATDPKRPPTRFSHICLDTVSSSCLSHIVHNRHSGNNIAL